MLCAKFGYYQRGGPPCKECWHGSLFSANPDRELYYYGVMEDVEGVPWDSNPEDELRYKHLNNGMHMFMLLLGPKCHFCNIQYRLPTSSLNESMLMMYITRCILHTGWGRESSRIKNHLLEVNDFFIKRKDIGKAPSYPYLCPHLVKDLLGMGPAVDMLTKSLEQGRISKISQFDTFRRS